MSYWSKAYGKLSFNKAKEYHSTSLELIKKHCNNCNDAGTSIYG